MSEVKHSPLPWTADRDLPHKRMPRVHAADGSLVCECGNMGTSQDQWEADAALITRINSYESDQAKIAALVEIAEELRSAIEARTIINSNQDTDDIGWFKEKIAAALALAEGQP